MTSAEEASLGTRRIEMSENTPLRKVDRRGLLGLLKEKQKKPQVEFVTIREEKRQLRRVVKPKPMARKHMSEALEVEELTDRQKEITEKVIESIVQDEHPQTRVTEESVKTFTCFQCNTKLAEGAERCHKCGVRYVHDVTPEQLRELAEAESDDSIELDSFGEKDDSPVVHFDAEMGVISLLREDGGDPDFSYECSKCGTLVGFDTERCPICGTRLEVSDTGLVSLFSDMDFDDSNIDEADCPYCGEHVLLNGGVCPQCGKRIEELDSTDSGRKLVLLLKGENVVFLHLDVETGELNYLQKAKRRGGYEQVSLQLEGIGKTSFSEDWHSLSRI